MPEWKLHNQENYRKITPQKVTENLQLEFARIENTDPGKYQNGKCTPWKMTEWKLYNPENDRKITPQK